MTLSVVRLKVLDSAVTLRCPAESAAELRRLYAPFRIHNDSPSGPGCGPGCGTELDGTGDLTDLCARINALALAEARCLAVHAGAVAVDGAVVAFPGSSGAGKSTLTAACLRAGMDYVSDEALCIDWQTAAVRPYPRPLALSPWSATAVGLPPTVDREQLVTAEELGSRPATSPLRLAHLVLLDSDEGGGLRPAPRSAAVAELLRRSFTSWHRPHEAFELVHTLLRDASVWHLGRSTPSADAAAIQALTRS